MEKSRKFDKKQQQRRLSLTKAASENVKYGAPVRAKPPNRLADKQGLKTVDKKLLWRRREQHPVVECITFDRALPVPESVPADAPAPLTERDRQFETIVNMFQQPVAFLVMADQSVEQVLEFELMEASNREQYLQKVFEQHVVPTLPDRVLGRHQLLLDGETYTLRRYVGAGGYGSVAEYATDHGQSIAVKVNRVPNFRKAIQELRGHFYAQGRTLSATTRRIAHLRGVAWTERGDLLMLMDYVPGGNYAQLIEKLGLAIGKKLIVDPRLIAAIHWTIIRDTTKCLAEVNSRSVAHKDVKSENLVIANGQARLCDFGVSKAGVESFDDDTVRLGMMARDYLGTYVEPPPEFESQRLHNKTPTDLLQDARVPFKENGVGGPHLRAVIEALTRFDPDHADELIAACDAYLAAAQAVEKGEASWKCLKSRV